MKVITIGRNNENNDVVVNDSKVSRNHLQMVMDDQGNYSVVDLNSTNGTFVNGQRITGKVHLKDTDELKIGDTVLPWLSYFSDSPNMSTNSPVPPQMLDPKRPVSSEQRMSAPTSKRWRLYVIVGIVVLLLAGLGLVWIVNHSKPVDNVGQEEISPAKDDQNIINENNALKEELKYQQELREAAEKQVIEERSNSEKYREEATRANNAKNAAKQEAAQANNAKNAAEQEAVQANNAKNAAEQEAARANKEKEAANQKAKNNADKLKEAETKNSSLEYTQKMERILKQWRNGDALDYCNYKGYKYKGDNPNRSNAKELLSDRFSNLKSNAEKEKMIIDMDKWSQKEKIKNYKPID